MMLVAFQKHCLSNALHHHHHLKVKTFLWQDETLAQSIYYPLDGRPIFAEGVARG